MSATASPRSSQSAPGASEERYARDPSYGKPPSWARLYREFFPYFTDPWSRHARLIADEVLRSPKSKVRRLLIDNGYEPDHWASAIEATVKALWTTRAKARREACADARSALFDATLLQLPERSRPKVLAALTAAWSEVVGD